jgi:hypothetical protein
MASPDRRNGIEVKACSAGHDEKRHGDTADV